MRFRRSRQTVRRQTFRSFWYGAALSPFESMCLSSFIKNGHRFELFAYDTLVVPSGVVLRNANEVVPVQRLDQLEIATAAFADLFRYHMLAQYGGWWVDTDIVCLSSEVPNRVPFFVWQDENLINNAILRFNADECVPRRLLANAEARLSGSGTKLEWGALGPLLLTELLKELHLSTVAYPPRIAYAIPWQNGTDLLDPSKFSAVASKISDAPFLHLWNEILRINNVDKYVRPARGSYLARLFEIYL
jgi:hypothetical protein